MSVEVAQQVDFSVTNLPVNKEVYKEPYEMQEKALKWLMQFDEKHKKAYTIAYEHLESSFDLIKCTGFQAYLAKLEKDEEEMEKKLEEKLQQEKLEEEEAEKEKIEEEKEKPKKIKKTIKIKRKPANNEEK